MGGNLESYEDNSSVEEDYGTHVYLGVACMPLSVRPFATWHRIIWPQVSKQLKLGLISLVLQLTMMVLSLTR